MFASLFSYSFSATNTSRKAESIEAETPGKLKEQEEPKQGPEQEQPKQQEGQSGVETDEKNSGNNSKNNDNIVSTDNDTDN